MRTMKRRPRVILGVLAATLALAAITAPVAAASPKSVTIVSNVTFNPDGPNYGDFVTSGTATDSGLICPSGTFVDIGLHFTGFQSDRGMVQVQVVKEFTCDDGSGTFVAKLQIQANFVTGIENFSWVVLDGTDAYASLRGAGGGSTVPTSVGNINTYVGFLRT